MSQSPDIPLVSRLRAGELSAFDEVYEAYQGRIFGFLLRLTGSRPQAEELSQETWLRLARGARSLHPDTQLRPWLFTVARNLYHSQRRRKLLELDFFGWARRTEPTENTVETPFELTAERQLQRRLEAGLQQLPLAQREALLLVAVEKLSLEEAAEVVQVSPAAFRQRLCRARGELARRLADEG